MADQVYKPQTLTRTGELNAWILFFVAAAGVFFLSLRAEVPQWAWFMVALLAFSALSISLGNWMDRNTQIQISEEGISYKNGLRSVSFAWVEIDQVRVTPANWGRSVQVVARSAFFTYKTFGEMKFRDEVKSRTGFEEGDQILTEIIQQAGLANVEQKGPSTFYSR